MKEKIFSKQMKFMTKRKWHHKQIAIFLLLAGLVAFVTTYLLILPAITMSEEDIEDSEIAEIEPNMESAVELRHFFYEDEQLSVSVDLPADTQVPEDAVLTVTPIVMDDPAYEGYVEEANRVASGSLQELKLFDLSFYTAEGSYLPVGDNAAVSMYFKETIPAENAEQVAVLHFEEEQVALPTLTEIQVEEENGLSSVSFDTVGFSVYGVVTWTEAMDLDGKSYAIVNIDQDCCAAMQAELQQGTNNKLASISVNTTQVNSETYVTGENLTIWNFTKNGNGYFIWTGTENNKQYLYIGDDNSSLSLSTEPQQLFVGKSASYAGKVCIYNNNNYAVNWYGGDNVNNQVFGSLQIDTANSDNYHILATPIEDASIFFDVNLPTIKGTGWKNGTPTTLMQVSLQNMQQLNEKPSGYTEGLGAAGKLYAEKYGADVPNEFADLYRYNITDSYNFTTHNNLYHYLDGFDYYKEVRFDGWSYTDENGTVYLLEAGAPVIVNEDSTISVTDKNSISVVIPKGATLSGVWSVVSSPVEFFVNYAGTILDTEGDVTLRNQSLFTPCSAVGTLLFGEQTVGDDQLFGHEAHENIVSMITSVQNLDFSGSQSQIIIQYATDFREGSDEVYYNNPEHEINASIMQEHLLSWIRGDESMSIHLSTGDGNVTIANELATAENYQVRWYVLKDQADGWHVDGVMTATTKEMTITKSFQGLTQEQITDVLNQLQIKLKIENGIYMTMTKTPIDGQYTYQYDAATQTATWTVRIPNGEHYTVTEENYQYDASNYHVTASTILDSNPETQRIGDIAGKRSDSDADVYDIVGGRTKLVSFSNVYTQKKQVSLIILKTNVDTNFIIGGVTFTLIPIDENGTATEASAITSVTDGNGKAYFLDLPVGRYRLEETTPDGFQPNTATMMVTVTEAATADEIPTIIVTETQKDGTVNTYQNADGENVLVYAVENHLASHTLVVTKNFEDITYDEIGELLKNGYQIAVTDEKGETIATLNQNNATRISADRKQIIWNLTDLQVDKSYKLIESNYRSDLYLEVSVRAEHRIGKESGKELSVDIGESDSTASVVVTKSNWEYDQVTLTNSYANTFDLQLRKVDSVTGKPLQNAVFSLYGKHEEATDPSRTVQYQDANGNWVTLYYICDATATDENGYTIIRGLKLTDSGKTYVYVLQESTAPDGYLLPDTIESQQILQITPEQLTNGIYSLFIKNESKTETMTVEKQVNGTGTDPNAQYPVHITIFDTDPFAEATEKHSFSYDILSKTDTIVKSSSFLEGTTLDISLQANQKIVLKNIPVGFHYTITEDIMNADGSVAYYPYITADGVSVWNDTITGTIHENTEDTVYNQVLITNYMQKQMETGNLSVQKEWPDTEEADRQMVTVQLYQKQMDAKTGENLGTILYETVTLGTDNQWMFTWKNLPKSNWNQTVNYSYYIREIAIDHYEISYYMKTETEKIFLQPETISLSETESISALPVVLDTDSQIVIQNTREYQLPMTGGMGRKYYFWIGGFLSCGACILFLFLKKRKRTI